jgi:hypothetical protein
VLLVALFALDSYFVVEPTEMAAVRRLGQALREQELLAYVKARAEFLWEGWVRQETRWELVPLVALAWHWLHRGANQGVYLANQAFGSLRNLGHFAETEPLIRRALALEEARFGLNHPNVATCLNNLAALLHETARLKEAELCVAYLNAHGLQAWVRKAMKIAL